MGNADAFNLGHMKQAGGLEAFVETGTYKGGGIEEALRAGFTRVYSTDIEEAYVDFAKDKYRDRGVKIFNLYSDDFLKKIIPEINGIKCFFWLDAHLPEIYSKKSITDKDKISPLVSELEILAGKKGIEEDLIICDDLRMYEEGPFLNGACEDKYLAGHSLDPVLRLFEKSHTIERSYIGEGYLILRPRQGEACQ